MAIGQAINCDACGKQKGAVNCWWMVFREGKRIEIEPWGEDYEVASEHLCGQDCLIKSVSKWMQEKTEAVSK